MWVSQEVGWTVQELVDQWTWPTPGLSPEQVKVGCAKDGWARDACKTKFYKGSQKGSCKTKFYKGA